MTDDARNRAAMTSLIAAREVALRVLEDAQAHELATAADSVADGPAPRPRARPKTTSAALLHKAAETLGLDSIAQALGVNSEALAHFLRDDSAMTLPQQRTLALAVLLLCDEHDDLRRRATALLGQVRAAADFEAGVTVRHMNAPPSTLEWH